MPIKPTIIGATPAQAGDKPSPTQVGGVGTGGAAPAPATATSSIRPTAFKPTAMPAGAPAPAPASPVKPSAMPGVQRKPLQVTYEMLAKRFPGAERADLERAQAAVARVSPQGMDASAWLKFGMPGQEKLSALVKTRVSLMEGSAARSVAQHLARMQSLLQDVLDAMDGGFLKRPASKVWEAVGPEVRQLEQLLRQSGEPLTWLLGTLANLQLEAGQIGDDVQADALAAEFLVDHVDESTGHLLLSRATSLQSSAALVLEQVQALTLDKDRVQNLTTLVQDGVLVQLPAVYSQLVGLSAKPSDTQRYLASEKLADLVHNIKRKL